MMKYLMALAFLMISGQSFAAYNTKDPNTNAFHGINNVECPKKAAARLAAKTRYEAALHAQAGQGKQGVK